MKIRTGVALILVGWMLATGCKTYQSVLSPGTEGIDSVTLSRLQPGKEYRVLLANDSLIQVKVVAADYQTLTCETSYVDHTAPKLSTVVAVEEEVISSQGGGPTVLPRASIKDVQEWKASFQETKQNIGGTMALALIITMVVLVDNYIKSL